MPPERGRSLAKILLQGRLIEIADSYTLIPEDQPVKLAGTIRDFVRDTPGLRPYGAADPTRRKFLMVDFVSSRSRTIGYWITTAIIAADSVRPLAKRSNLPG